MSSKNWGNGAMKPDQGTIVTELNSQEQQVS